MSKTKEGGCGGPGVWAWQREAPCRGALQRRPSSLNVDHLDQASGREIREEKMCERLLE